MSTQLDNAKADERLKSPSNIALRFAKVDSPQSIVKEIPIGRTGRKSDKPNLPSFVQNSIAILTRTGETQKSVGQEFGTSQAHAGNIERGKVKGVDEAKVEESLSQVRDRALEKLMSSMGLIDDEKLKKCSAPELAQVASNMSRVVEKTLPRESGGGSNISLVVYAPEVRQEKSFKVVEI